MVKRRGTSNTLRQDTDDLLGLLAEVHIEDYFTDPNCKQFHPITGDAKRGVHLGDYCTDQNHK